MYKKGLDFTLYNVSYHTYYRKLTTDDLIPFWQCVFADFPCFLMVGRTIFLFPDCFLSAVKYALCKSFSWENYLREIYCM
jgi:hypothetical protein